MDYNPDTIWIPETWGMENFAITAAVSQKALRPRIGSSIINVYSRSPALVAMGAATVDTLSNGRFVLGLGASSKPIIEDLHGAKYTSQIGRMREYVDVIKMAFSGKRIDYDGKFFKLQGFKILVKPPQTSIPIYLAAVNKKMVDLCWDIADRNFLSDMRISVSMSDKRFAWYIFFIAPPVPIFSQDIVIFENPLREHNLQ